MKKSCFKLFLLGLLEKKKQETKKTIDNRLPMDLVRLIDQDGAVLVCSSGPVFEFVLGGDPDRLVRVTGRLERQPGLEVQLAVGATASFPLCWPTDFLQPLFNQRLRQL